MNMFGGYLGGTLDVANNAIKQMKKEQINWQAQEGSYKSKPEYVTRYIDRWVQTLHMSWDSNAAPRVIEEIRKQRAAILQGTWVKRAPNPGENQACLVAAGANYISAEAEYVVSIAIGRLYPAQEGLTWSAAWNDHECPSAGMAIDVLDEAELLAKQWANECR